ncbi:MAG: Wzz/FepE/Etk N-terminal domain-containing protein [Pseudomonadota bacterium]
MNSDISILDAIALVYRRKWIAVLFTFLGAVAGLAIGFLTTPVYRSQALLSVVEQQDTRSGLADLASQFGGLAGAAGLSSGGSDRNVAIAVLQSRDFCIGFILERGIDKIMYADRLGDDGETWIEELGGAPSESDVYERFRKQVFSVREDSKTGLITVAMEWFDPALAARWANGIVDEINLRLRTRARERATNSIAYLESEVENTINAETKQAIYRLIEQQVNEIMLANVTEEYAFEVIDPATPSDPEDEVKPRKLFLLIAGTVSGFIFALALIVALELRGAAVARDEAPATSGEPS